ncbi:MAG: 4-alpha-glucanotransferase [Enterobacteriaceae bacterium]
MKPSSLISKAQQAGIASHFLDMEGQEQAIGQETLRTLLSLLSPQQDKARPLAEVQVCTQGARPRLPVRLQAAATWSLHLEQGGEHTGQLSASACELSLPGKLPLGYHQLTLHSAGKTWHCRVIIAPRRCYEPEAIHQGQKLWGTCLQLYTLRSADNWGIGDFGDLYKICGEIAHRGGAFIGLNPLHALYPAVAERASPYSPSSRRWLNIIYIDLNQVSDFIHSPVAQKWWHKSQTRQRLQTLRESEWVNYSGVMALKQEALQLAFQQFCQRAETDQALLDFRQFVHQGGESLYRQGLFDALQAHLCHHEGGAEGWQAWPAQWQQPDSPQVLQFAQQQATQIECFLWAQWLAQQQLERCYQHCQALQMSIGLYRDLAVGVARGSAETWSDRPLYCMQATVGAPPDKLGPLGQDWQLPPLQPQVLRQRAYQPFIDLLRANMRACGALRLDHVMGLMRLWWIPQGQGAGKGAYVHYPVDDLLAILALESQRQRCMVTGEDLGIVPKEIVGKLRQYGIYSYKVLYFEQKAGRFRAPQVYPAQALATITTHDLPTLYGYWQQDDLTRGTELGFYPDAALRQRLCQERRVSKQGLLDALHHYRLVPQRCARTAQRSTMTALLSRGIQRYIASSASTLVGIQPEEWLKVTSPVNIPGTVEQYPNWRRKLPVPLEQIFTCAQVEWLIRDLNRYRGKGHLQPK